MEASTARNLNLNSARIMIAGASSGVGKTSITMALVLALMNRGMKVQTFKVGPDYLDPTYLALVSGRPCYNLDSWMMGIDHVRRLFASKSYGCDICVIEGVMGFFDGASASSLEGSSAEIAKWLEIPSIVIVSAHGAGRTFAALVKGLAEFDPIIPVSGIIANFCGSERHSQSLSESLRFSNLPDLAGAIPRESIPMIPRRHLGLVTADQDLITPDIMDALARVGKERLKIDEIIRIARSAASIPYPEPAPGTVTPRELKIRLGLAYDEAFHFYYQDNLEILEAHGFEVIRFSPINDVLDLSMFDAIYIGGGYPEEFVGQLSTNQTMLSQIRAFSNMGRPVYAECGGLMYLSEGIETLDGKRFGMAGVLPAWTRMKSRFKALRYVEITLNQDSLFGSRGESIRGHEFHYSELVNDPCENSSWTSAYTSRRKASGDPTPEGFQNGNILISYVHAHFASRPASVERFRQVCEMTIA